MLPGRIALTVTRLGASSMAAVRMKPSWPALLAPYPVQPGYPVIGPVIDEVRMTRPRPERCSAGRQAWTENTVPFRLTPSTWSRVSSVMSASRLSGKTPALAHSTSTPPSRSMALAAIRRQSSRLDTSAWMNETSPGSAARASSSSAAARAASESRPVIRTRAPLRANTLAMPLPMPRVPPVTTTARPAIDVNMPLVPFSVC